MVIKPVDLEDVRLARAAHVRFGKGTGHPAQLNFGDCFSYALARRLGASLLFRGSDFSYTDITPAL
jgi:ribonuclease VapC